MPGRPSFRSTTGARRHGHRPPVSEAGGARVRPNYATRVRLTLPCGAAYAASQVSTPRSESPPTSDQAAWWGSACAQPRADVGGAADAGRNARRGARGPPVAAGRGAHAAGCGSRSVGSGEIHAPARVPAVPPARRPASRTGAATTRTSRGCPRPDDWAGIPTGSATAAAPTTVPSTLAPCTCWPMS